MTCEIFVFGSNLAGRHGKGAALEARKNHGAIYGVGVGPQGESYAIPTKNGDLTTRYLSDIGKDIEDFKVYARAHPELRFNVTRVGCGLAGYRDEDIAPFFADAPDNCVLSDEWKEILSDKEYMSFITWYRDSKQTFANSMYSEENIAYAAWSAGRDYEKSLHGKMS